MATPEPGRLVIYYVWPLELLKRQPHRPWSQIAGGIRRLAFVVGRRVLPPRVKDFIKLHILRMQHLRFPHERVVSPETRAHLTALREKLPSTYDVVFFPIIDWAYRYQRPQHLASQFAGHGHRVFYVDTTFANDLLVRQLATNVVGVRLPSRRRTNIYAGAHLDTTPKFLEAVALLRSEYEVGHCICVVQFPFWTPLALELRKVFGWLVVYDCLDHHVGWTNVSERVVQQEERLIREADLVVVTSRALERELCPNARRCLRVPNAGDFEHFQASSGSTPPELNDLSGPIIGYYGAISDWFDVELVRFLAEARPEYQFVLIGHVHTNVLRLERLPNIHFLGEKPYEILPEYLHAFDVCIIPFRRIPLTDATDPVKVYEYLAAGKAVVSTPLPELIPLHDVLTLVDDREDWVSALDQALTPVPATEITQRRAFAAQNTWQHRFEVLANGVEEAHPLVSIVVVTFNNLHLTRICVESILSETLYPHFELILVDNGSTDETPNYLREISSDPRIHIVLNSDNLGFAAANNQGIEHSHGEFLVLLNNDTIVTRGWLTALLRHLKTDSELGMVGPVTNWAGNEARIDVAYESLLDMPAFARQHVQTHHGELFDIPMLAMFCVALRRSTYDAVGQLDETFGIGMFEDDDYSRRVRAKGYRVMCTEDVFVHHFGKAAFNQLDESKYNALFERNRRLYEDKWKTPWKPHRARDR